MADVSNIQRALYLLRKKKVNAAIRLLEATTRGLPAHLMAHVLLARAYELKRQWEDALAAWDEAHLLMPTSPLVQAGRERVLEKRAQQARPEGDTADIADLLRDISDALAAGDETTAEETTADDAAPETPPANARPPQRADDTEETDEDDAGAAAESAEAEAAAEDEDDAVHMVLDDLLSSESERPTGEIEIPSEDDMDAADLDDAVGNVLSEEDEAASEVPDDAEEDDVLAVEETTPAPPSEETAPEPVSQAPEPEAETEEQETTKRQAEELLPTNVFLSGGPPDEDEPSLDDVATVDDEATSGEPATDVRAEPEPRGEDETLAEATPGDSATADGDAPEPTGDTAEDTTAEDTTTEDTTTEDTTTEDTTTEDTDDEDTLPDLPGSTELLDAIQSETEGEPPKTAPAAEGDGSAESDAETSADEAMAELERLRERATAEARMGGARPDLAASLQSNEADDDEAADEADTSDQEEAGDLDRLIQELESARITPNPTPDSIEEETDAPAVPGIDLEEDDVGEMVSETLGRIYASQGRYREAARIYVKLAAQEPEDARTHLETASQLRAKSDAIRNARNETRRSDDA